MSNMRRSTCTSSSWLLVIFVLSAKFHISAPDKDRSSGRFGLSRSSPKHNSIAAYYRDLHRPVVEKCLDAELPQRVSDAAAIFTGTVRDLVLNDSRSGQTAIVEIKRVVKGEDVVDKFTSSLEQLGRRGTSLHRRGRRMVAVTGL